LIAPFMPAIHASLMVAVVGATAAAFSGQALTGSPPKTP